MEKDGWQIDGRRGETKTLPCNFALLIELCNEISTALRHAERFSRNYYYNLLLSSSFPRLRWAEVGKKLLKAN